MIGWLTSLVLPVAGRYLKSLALQEIGKEGNALRDRVKLAVDEKGPGEIDNVLNDAKSRLIAAISSRGPSWAFLQPIRAKLAAAVSAHLDDLAAQLKAAVAKGQADQEIDAVFAEAEGVLEDKISALPL